MWHPYITIEGIGDAQSDQLYRWSFGSPSFDGAGYYQPDLYGLPPEIETRIDFREGSSTVGGLRAELRPSPLLASWLYDQLPTPLGKATAALTASGSSLSTDQTAGQLTGQAIVWGREVLYCVFHVGGGTYNVLRGRLGTTAVAHGATATDDVTLFGATSWPVPLDRRVTLGRVWDTPGASYADEVTLWTGVLRDISAPSPEVIEIVCDSALTLLDEVSICNDLWRGYRVSDRLVFAGRSTPRATSGTVSISVSAQGAYRDAAWVTEPGGGATLNLFDGRLLAPALSAEPDLDTVSEVWEFFRCTGTGATAALPLSRNVFTLLLQLLTTTATGANFDSLGGATNYDVGVEDLGAGIPWDYVDVAQIESVRARIGPLADFDRLELGFDGEPIQLLKWIQETLLRPLGCVLTVGAGGKLRVAQLLDQALPTGTTTVTQSDAIYDDPTPAQRRRLRDPVDSVKVSWAWRAGDGTRTDVFNDVFRQRRTIRSSRSTQTLDLRGVGDEGQAEQIAVWYVTGWRYPLGQSRLSGFSTLDLYPGDLISLTHDKIYRVRGGVRGVTGDLCLVIARSLRLADVTLSFSVLHVGQLFTGQRGLIAPAGRVASYNAGTRTITLDTGVFSSGAGPYATDAAPFADNDVVRLTNRDHSPSGLGDIQLVQTSGSNLTHSGGALLPAPTAGQLVKLAPYDSATATARALWAFLADAAQTVGSGSDPAYQWGR